MQKNVLLGAAVILLALAWPAAPVRAETNAACEADCVSTYNTTINNCPIVSTPAPGGGQPQSAPDPTCVSGAESAKLICTNDCGQSATPAAGGNTAAAPGKVVLLNPLGITDPRLIVGRIIKGVLSIVGTLTLAMFMYGGFLWTTSMGEADKVKKGKNIFVWTTLGLAMIAGAYTAVNAIMNALRTGSVTG